MTSAANIPYSGISPGGVDMATGELIVVIRPDLRLDGPMPVEFGRYYASMLSREGFAAGHLGPNWLGTYDWSLSVSPVSGDATVVTNRGQRIQFQQLPAGGFTLLQPLDQQYRLDVVGATLRFTHPGLRRVYSFDSSTMLLSGILDEHGNALSLTYSGGLVSQVSDGLGRVITLSYDTSSRVIQAGDGTRTVGYGYTGDVLTTVTDAAGQVWTHTSDPGPISGLLTGITEPLSNTPLTQTYDELGRVASQVDAAAGSSLYAYDATTGATFTDPLGNAWTYAHDTGGRLQSLTDPTTEATSFGYDTSGRLASVTRPLGDATSIAYDPASSYPDTLTLADGSLIRWTYSSHAVGGTGGTTMFDLATADYPDTTTESYGRDAAGNLADFTDRGGFHWLGTYNSRGQPLTLTNPSLGVTTFTYDDTAGRPATAEDNAGNTTQFGYDGLSRLTQVTWPDATGRQYAYDALDRRTSLTDERSKVWSRGYDANGRLASATNPLLEVTSWVYDLLDRVTQVVDPLSHATVYAYDAAGRVASVTDRSGRTVTFQYETVGRLTGVVDPAGGTDTYAYDANSRVTSMQDPLTHVTLMGYDDLDRVTSVTDPVGSLVTYAYDSMGRLTSAVAPLGHTETFTYDPRGLLTSFTNVTAVTGWPRTSLGEAAQVTDPNLNGWPRSYDPQGRLTSAADPLARTTGYEYDALSRPSQITRPDASTKQLAYDAAGRLTGASYSGGPTLAYGYDDANRLTSATGATFAYDAAGRMITSNGIAMTYDDAGRLLSQTLATGKVVTYVYNTRGLLSQVTDWLGGTTSFTYDTARQLTGMTRPNGTEATYGYDAADRLISAVEVGPGPSQTPLSSITITRDALGRPTSIDRRQPLMPGETMLASATFAYDAASQMNGVGHDSRGRTTTEGSRTFAWDGASRLTRYAAGADSPQFSYDAFGRLLTRTLGTQTEQLLWNYATGAPVRVTKDPGPIQRYFVHTSSGLLLYGVDGSTGARLFYHYDESGNTIYLTNDSGSVVTEYAYKPFGGVTALGQTADNRFTYGAAGGLIALGTSGLWSVGSRVYDDRTMRVISGITTQSGPAGWQVAPHAPGDAARDHVIGGAVAVWTDNRDVRPPPDGDWAGYTPPSRPPNPNAPQTSGLAEIIGNDWVTPLGAFPYSLDRIRRHEEQAGTLAHEIGHSIGLDHGGPGPSGNDRFLPNQVSVMNYRYQSGILTFHGEVGGDDLVLSAGGSGSATKQRVDAVRYQGGTLVHELGHSIGLCHGGAFDAGRHYSKKYRDIVKNVTSESDPWRPRSEVAVYGNEELGLGRDNDAPQKITRRLRLQPGTFFHEIGYLIHVYPLYSEWAHLVSGGQCLPTLLD